MLATVHIKANLLKKQTKSQQTNDKYSYKKHDATTTKQNKTEKTELSCFDFCRDFCFVLN
jgi:hypothetical protein